MENGTAIHRDVDGDRHDFIQSSELSAPRAPFTSKSTPFAATTKPTSHRRSTSGSILARLNFLRTSSEDNRPALNDIAAQDDAEVLDDEDDASSGGTQNAMALAQQAVKGRKRKGSLRKTALLGPGKFFAESRERRNSLLQRAPSNQQASPDPSKAAAAAAAAATAAATVATAISPVAAATGLVSYPTPPPAPVEDEPRRFSYDVLTAASSSDAARPAEPTKKLSLNTALPASISPVVPAPLLASPIKSPTSQSYASTTDEEETLSFSRPTNGHLHPPASTSASYFASPQSLTRRRSTKQAVTPLVVLPVDAYRPEVEWSYSDTEWWGWVVLVVTWIVFVVGMGSCLELWSWAWDVGQTPYAPPDLEDDPTLPIVGYYPALIILTAVMAWVWVVVAWVGMKYFKHATIQGDE